MEGISADTCGIYELDSSDRTTYVSGDPIYTLNDYSQDKLYYKPCGYYFYLEYDISGTESSITY